MVTPVPSPAGTPVLSPQASQPASPARPPKRALENKGPESPPKRQHLPFIAAAAAYNTPPPSPDFGGSFISSPGGDEERPLLTLFGQGAPSSLPSARNPFMLLQEERTPVPAAPSPAAEFGAPPAPNPYLPSPAGFGVSRAPRIIQESAAPEAPSSTAMRNEEILRRDSKHPLFILDMLEKTNLEKLGSGAYMTVYRLTEAQRGLIFSELKKIKDPEDEQTTWKDGLIGDLDGLAEREANVVFKVFHKPDLSFRMILENLNKELMSAAGPAFSECAIHLADTRIYPDHGVIVQQYLPKELFTEDQRIEIQSTRLFRDLSFPIQQDLMQIRALVEKAQAHKVSLDLSFDNFRRDAADRIFITDPVERDGNEAFYLQYNRTLKGMMRKYVSLQGLLSNLLVKVEFDFDS